MIKVIRITKPECYGCMGASLGDCADCKTRTQEITLCKDCSLRDESIMHREKLLCTKLHAWVEPYEFCAWGDSEVEE